MREVEVEVSFVDAEEADRWMAAFVSRHGLAIASRGSLRKYKGSVHWHLKKAGHKGMLEPTWWPKTGRFWFKVASNRNAEWIEELLKTL